MNVLKTLGVVLSVAGVTAALVGVVKKRTSSSKERKVIKRTKDGRGIVEYYNDGVEVHYQY